MSSAAAGLERAGLRPLRGDATPEFIQGRIRLRGEGQWIFSGSTAEVEAIAAALPGVHTRVDSTVLLLEFGNAVGHFDLPVLGRVEVISGKWTAAHFDSMLREVSAIATGLPFSAGDGAALPFDRSVRARRDVLYHAFVYLRHVLSDAVPREKSLHGALAQILREPHRLWLRIEEATPVDRLRSVGPRTVQALLGGGPQMSQATRSKRAASLVGRLNGNIPEKLPEPRVRSTLDTAENRFVKALLDQALTVCRAMSAEAVREQNAFTSRVVADSISMERKLAPLRRHSVWREVGRMRHLPTGSAVLQRRRGYREVLEHFSRLRLATRIPLDPAEVKRLLEAKDIALLYELWTFFVLVRGVERLLGRPKRTDPLEVDAFRVSLPHRYLVEWDGGVVLSYNPTFSPSHRKHRRSYSVPLRPDIALELSSAGDPAVHLFDAKFKVERLDSGWADDETALAEEEDAERRGLFKRADLYKMHAYRDAIPAAQTVWILYPGTELRYFPSDGSAFASGLKSLPDQLDGVGAIPLLPGQTPPEDLQGVLERLLGEGGDHVGL